MSYAPPCHLELIIMASLDYTVEMELPYGDSSVIPHILLANLPQTIISFIYLVYNAQFTAMLAHREWSNYVIKRAPLRVTNPLSGERSTYYLQLPFRFSIPLLLASSGLHFLISQALFLVRIIVYQDGKPVPVSGLTMLGGGSGSDIYSAVCYSLSAIVASIGWGLALVLALFAFARFATYPAGLPVGGTNSAVISAACHIQQEERDGEDSSTLPLKWGVTIPGSKDMVGHCSFSSGEVDFPDIGCLYAGFQHCPSEGYGLLPGDLDGTVKQ
jgi:hypothetical protein